MNIVKVTDPQAIDDVAALAREIWREHYTSIIGQAQVEYMLGAYQSSSAISHQISDEGYQYYLLKGASLESVGYIAIVTKENEIFLSKFYVKKNARGHGWGRQALGFVQGLAKEAGLRRITLTVNKNNTDSIAAYLRMGFKNMGSVTIDIGNGFYMDDYKMEKVV